MFKINLRNPFKKRTETKSLLTESNTSYHDPKGIDKGLLAYTYHIKKAVAKGKYGSLKEAQTKLREIISNIKKIRRTRFI